VGYRGTAYAGWAAQPGQTTVQSVIEAALARAFGHPVRAIAAGRTDAGVHADGQVVSFSTTAGLPTSALPHVMPQWLPPDVWPIEAADVAAGFDARRAARRRWYRYAVWRGSVPPSGWHGRALAHPEDLDLSAMRAASRSLLGKHDFAAFATQPPPERSTTRTVVAADWLELGPLLMFEVCADGFLKQMVRSLVGSMLWVGGKHRTPEQFAAALANADRRAAGPNAPAHGLTLSRIEY